MTDILAVLFVIVVLLFWIGLKVERIERHARRESMSAVDREMEDLNPKGISK